MFDEILQSNEPVMTCQFASDNALLVSLAGHDHLVPSEIEPFAFSRGLFVESKEILNATILICLMKSDLETENFGKAQMFSLSPQREQLSHSTTMFIDPFARLVPGDKFHISRILVVPVNDTFDAGCMLDTCLDCHTRACTYSTMRLNQS